MQYIYILMLAFLQNVSFSIVSRARNRSSFTYHMIAAVMSNAMWYLTFKMLFINNMDILMFLPYCAGTVTGSLFGARVSMLVETWLGADSDGHLKKA